MKPVLNPETLAAMPAMKAADNPVGQCQHPGGKKALRLAIAEVARV